MSVFEGIDWDAIHEGVEDEEAAARTTENQFRALAVRLSVKELLAETAEHLRTRHRKKKNQPSKQHSFEKVRAWLFNCWGTEAVLRSSQTVFGSEATPAVIQWSFPQAYYAAFAAIHACLEVSGRQASNHAKLMSAFGSLAASGHYPHRMSFLVDGTKRNVRFVALDQSERKTSSLALNVLSESSVDGHICQFLNATRKMMLKDRREKMSKNFRTARGAEKVSLSEADWERVSSACGPTTLMHLLYRKRIKSNYHDVELFSSDHLRASNLHRDLVAVVEAMVGVHEMNVAHLLGVKVCDLMEEYQRRCAAASFLEERRGLVARFLADE